MQDSASTPTCPAWIQATIPPEPTVLIDIIVCVHNALEDVKRCLNSIENWTQASYHLILVNDGSDETTSAYLHTYVHANTCAKKPLLIRNKKALGYTCAANQGMQAAKGDALVLLNSDTIVTPDWLNRLWTCANTESNIGIVGPLSNTASWQSVPNIEYRGDWASNPLPEGFSVSQMGYLVAGFSGHIYPKLPFLNGFCLLIKHTLLADIGFFDEDNFAQGYGEENDFCIRARQAGWDLAVADDVYIYHAQSKSYSHARRKTLADRAGQILADKHGQAVIDAGVEICRNSPAMQGIRVRHRAAFARWFWIQQAQWQWAGYKIAFILPVTESGGGGNIVIAEARAMSRMGIDICLINFAHHRAVFEKNHPNLDIPVIYLHDADHIPDFCIEQQYDAVIATAHQSVAWLEPLAKYDNPPTLGYYIQDFEPYFFIQKPAQHAWFWRYPALRRRIAGWYFRRSVDFRQAWLSYLTIPNMRCFTKTHWNQREVMVHTGRKCTVIGSSFNADGFMPTRLNPELPNTPLKITAMIRPSSPRRGAKRTLRLLQRLKIQYEDKIEIITFGVEAHDPLYQALPKDFAHEHLGLQTSQQVASLFNRVDVFVDFSDFQAMGLTAIEAMACGLAVVLPRNGGSESFAQHQENACLVDSFNEENCYQTVCNLVEQAEQRQHYSKQALLSSHALSPEKTAYKILHTMLGKEGYPFKGYP